ncbi:hypothetical protein FACS1894177_09490 [Bacteroidia bacterium]|nr:hypothetical protein FACS1894177_09490 [Bacteroidia bacterium]
MFFFNVPIVDYGLSSFDYNSELNELGSHVVAEYYDPQLPKKMIFNTWDSKSMAKADTFAFLHQEEFTNTWIQLYQAFEQSFKEKESLFAKISFDKIISDFSLSLNQILLLSPNVVTVGVSNDECIYIYSEFGNKSVFFDLFFDENEQTEALLNISENKKSICSYSNEIDSTISKLKEFVQKPNYELSEPLVALS